MFEQEKVMNAVFSAYGKLPKDGVSKAYQVIQREIPGILEETGPLFRPAPAHILVPPLFTPMMRLVSQELHRVFSGEKSGRTLIIVLSATKEERVLSRKENEDGEVVYGIDCFGPYQCHYPKKVRFRKQKNPVRNRVSFEEVCLYTGDPRAVHRAVYQLLDSAACYILHGQKKAS